MTGRMGEILLTAEQRENMVGIIIKEKPDTLLIDITINPAVARGFCNNLNLIAAEAAGYGR